MADSPTFSGAKPPIWKSNQLKCPSTSTTLSNELLHQFFPNKSTYLLLNWWLDGSNTSARSLQQFNSLVTNVLTQSDFDPHTLVGFCAEKEMERIDNLQNGPEVVIQIQDRWMKTDVTLPMCPPTGVKYSSFDEVPTFPVPGMFHHSLVDLVKSALSEPAAETFHLFPFEEYWVPAPDRPPQRVLSEVYTSPIFIEEYLRVQNTQKQAGLQMESVVIGLLFWSDSTHLTSFGNSSLWPIYVYFGNQSKYSHSKPSMFSAHHLAYIPKLPQSFLETYSNIFDEPPTKETTTQARRKLIHIVWMILLDQELVHVYMNGFDWEYWDGVIRRNFLRIITHLMDYQENNVVKDTLGPRSSTPIRVWTPYSLEHGFDYHQTIVPDVMHKGELGVFKAIFIHLLRLLNAIDLDDVVELNYRYQSIPTFGCDTIRKFPLAVSAMEKLAARDYEDMLQPLRVLFDVNSWHSSAKLRSHRLTTVAELENITRQLGISLRKFVASTCEEFDTKPLEKEVAKKARRKAAAKAKAGASGVNKGKARAKPEDDKEGSDAPAKAQFNMLTYKLHAFGHYTEKIARYGTTDNYSTQTGELEHRRVKKFYPTAYKQDYVAGIAKQQ
ncbi:hypothetical protein EST38_g11124 [Candolleomyces aberdarensis]|uniref:Uncharacterized protein n=1 Tax=Candolleomyces aberdarensis TaxID=2316362 RepID=A0A4Q2D5L7_9AGAR|nr:hypothetical protein EST38_g11124 [Candolleomyces aberdarensis]